MFWDDEFKPTEALPAVGSRRPPSVPIAEALAESALAKKLGWDLAVFRGQRGVDINGGAGDYRLLGAASLDHAEPRLGLLRVSSFAKFGNAVRQLRNVFAVARKHGVRRIELPAGSQFFAGERAAEFTIGWGVSPSLPGLAEPTGLLGRFYYLDALRLQPSAEEQARIMQACVRPLLTPGLRQPRPEVRDDDLMLHFRSGDVFGVTGKHIHREYGQPPLAFYLAAVEREQPARVWLVYQDRGNPLVDAIENALRAKGIPVIAQSGDLLTDVHLLLSATRIVGGVGSFVTAIAALSTRAKRLYLFGATVPALQGLGITIVEGRDTVGDYHRAVRRQNWTASAEQRALMLTYPAANLDFVEHEGA